MTDNSFVPAMVAGAMLFLVFLFFIVIYILIHIRRQKQNEEERTRLIYENEQRILRARLDEHERAVGQISREIHDNVSQQVDFLQMNLRALQEEVRAPGQERFLTNSSNIATRLARDLRNISYSLSSNYIEAKGLGEVLCQETEHLSASRGLRCSFSIEGIYRTLPPETELIIYRIAQEALHNALKHAAASEIEVRLSYEPASFRMLIQDNGLGFDPGTVTGRTSLGLHNMEQRALMLNGRLLLDSAPGEGCRLSFVLEEKY